MQAGAGQAPDPVPRADRRAVDQVELGHAPDDATGQVEVPLGVDAGHLGRLAPEQGATVLAAGAGRPLDHALEHSLLQATGGEVIEEEERLGPLDQHVVHAHSHGVDADRVVLIHLESQLELGSHAVGTAHEHRLLDIKRREIEHSAEGADVTHHAQPRGRSHVFLDAAHHFVSGLEVHTGLFITFRHNNSWF